MIKINPNKIHLFNTDYTLTAERFKDGIQILFDFGHCTHGVNVSSFQLISTAVKHLAEKLKKGVRYHHIEQATADQMIADAILAGTQI